MPVSKPCLYSNHACIQTMPVSKPCLYPSHACIQAMPVSKPCLYPNHACIQTMPVSKLCLYPSHACIQTMPVFKPCLYPSHACIQAMPVSKPCLYPSHACIQAMPVSKPCLYPSHACIQAMPVSKLCLYSNHACIQAVSLFQVPHVSLTEDKFVGAEGHGLTNINLLAVPCPESPRGHISVRAARQQRPALLTITISLAIRSDKMEQEERQGEAGQLVNGAHHMFRCAESPPPLPSSPHPLQTPPQPCPQPIKEESLQSTPPAGRQSRVWWTRRVFESVRYSGQYSGAGLQTLMESCSSLPAGEVTLRGALSTRLPEDDGQADEDMNRTSISLQLQHECLAVLNLSPVERACSQNTRSPPQLPNTSPLSPGSPLK
ncbi:hypothetical protein P4O66_011752, partial [Electrophorus voltai]